MRKKIASFLCLVFIFTLSSCGSSEKTLKVKAAKSEDEVVSYDKARELGKKYGFEISQTGFRYEKSNSENYTFNNVEPGANTSYDTSEEGKEGTEVEALSKETFVDKIASKEKKVIKHFFNDESIKSFRTEADGVDLRMYEITAIDNDSNFILSRNTYEGDNGHAGQTIFPEKARQIKVKKLEGIEYIQFKFKDLSETYLFFIDKNTWIKVDFWK